MSLFNRLKRDPDLGAPLTAGGRAGRAVEPGGDRRATSNERFGRWSEGIARGMGTPWFLLVLTVFCVLWLVWNTASPEPWRFDSAALGFTALTLILSLQASYAAPLILLVQIQQDRQRAERNLADTEFLAREVVALRLAIKDLPDRDFVRAELRALLADLAEEQREADAQEERTAQEESTAQEEADARAASSPSQDDPEQLESRDAEAETRSPDENPDDDRR